MWRLIPRTPCLSIYSLFSSLLPSVLGRGVQRRQLGAGNRHPPQHPGRSERWRWEHHTGAEAIGRPLCFGCKGNPWGNRQTHVCFNSPSWRPDTQAGSLSFSMGGTELLAKMFRGLQSLLMIGSVHHRHPWAAGPGLASLSVTSQASRQSPSLAP